MTTPKPAKRAAAAAAAAAEESASLVEPKARKALDAYGRWNQSSSISYLLTSCCLSIF